MHAISAVKIATMTQAHDWAEYLRAITGNATGRAISGATGISPATISRWLAEKTDPEPRQVVTVARAYDVNPLDALIVAGYLTEAEVQRPAELPRLLQLREFSEVELSREILRRVEANDSSILNDPITAQHPGLRLVGGANVGDLTDDQLDQLDKAAGNDDSQASVDDEDA